MVFEIKDGYKLWLQTPETKKLFGNTKKLIGNTKNQENVPSLELVEVVLVQCNLEDNKYQPFTPNISYAYLLNDEPSNLVFLKTYNTEFDKIIIAFTDKNGRPLEIDAIFYRTKNNKIS